MSKLLEKIRQDQVAARKARNKEEALLLTTLLGEASPGGTETVTDDQVQKVVQKFLKNLHEMIGYASAPEVVDQMKYEVSILERYQPVQLSENKLREIIAEIIASLGNVPVPKKVGMTMKELGAKYKGQYDGKQASAIVKELA